MTSKLNIWDNSIKLATRVESVIKDALNAAGHVVEKNNAENPRDVDLRSLSEKIEVKCAFTPYPKCPTPAKLAAAHHLTLDVSNVNKYDKDVLIIFAVNYPDTTGLYAIEAGKCQEIIETLPERVYSRSARTGKDKISKVGISLEECFHIPVPQRFLTKIRKIAEANK